MNTPPETTSKSPATQPIITDDEQQLVEALQRYEAMVKAERTYPLRAAAAALRAKKEQAP